MGRTLFLPILLILLACGQPAPTPQPVSLRAIGSTTMTPLLNDLAAAFHEQSPTVHLEVTGLGTQAGLEALRRGEADLAMASWLPAGLEPGRRATAIARDGLAVIVHPTNPADGLGLLQLQDLFSGRAEEWPAVGVPLARDRVQPVSREEGSGTRAAFEALVMGDRRVTPRAVLLPSDQAVVEYVATHPAAIGYVGMAWASSGVKVLRVEGELPTPLSTGQGSYVLTRELWLVTADPPSQAVQQFLDFILSPAGQQIVGRRYGRVAWTGDNGLYLPLAILSNRFFTGIMGVSWTPVDRKE